MSTNKPPNSENLDENFNEDFDFGEGETEVRPVKNRSSASYKKVLVLGFLVVLAIVLVLGYRMYSPKIGAITATLHELPSSAPVSPRAPAAPVTMPPASVAPSNTTATENQDFAEMANAFSESIAQENPAPTPTPAPAPAPATPPVAKSALLPPMPNPTPHSAPAASPAAEPTAEILPRVAELTQGLNKLNDQIDSILTQIKYLDSYSREVSENLNKLNEAITAMDSRLSALTNTTSTLSRDVGNVRNEVGQVRQVLKDDGLDINQQFDSGSSGDAVHHRSSAHKEAKVLIEQPEYTVHAVIPGRAWLKSARGQIMTVTEGDSIGNYGKVLVIDASNGVVLTSSGVAFR
jgi:prefoldin subunit 5